MGVIFLDYSNLRLFAIWVGNTGKFITCSFSATLTFTFVDRCFAANKSTTEKQAKTRYNANPRMSRTQIDLRVVKVNQQNMITGNNIKLIAMWCCQLYAFKLKSTVLYSLMQSDCHNK